MAGKEFSTDFDRIPSGISENHKMMIEDPYTGIEYWIPFSEFLSLFAKSGGLKDSLKDVNDRIPTLINTAIAALVDGAPDNLNTLKEIADALKEENLASTLINTLALKVDKQAGKGLSSNDYTADEKAEVAKIVNTVAYTQQDKSQLLKRQARKNIDVNKTFFTVPTSEVTNGDRLILNDKEYIRIDNAWVSSIPLINRYSDNAILDFSKILDIEAEILDLQNISSSN